MTRGVTNTTHDFVPSGRFKVSAIGRKLEYCDYPGCGKIRLGLTHKPIGKRSKLVKDGAWDQPAVSAEVPRLEAPLPLIEPWQIGMLRDALAHAQEVPVGWRVTLAIDDLRKALDLGADDPPLKRDPVLEEPAPLPALPRPSLDTRPSQRHANRKLIRSLPDNWRNLAERALDRGWTVDRAGGHLKFKGPDTELVTIPTSPGEGRGYLNARAIFKRYGLNVEGL